MKHSRRFQFVLIFAGSVWLNAAQDLARGQWQPATTRRGNGSGGWISQPAERQVLKHPDGMTLPFGLVRMDNGEIALLCSLEEAAPDGARTVRPIIAFSKDDGATWTDFTIIAGAAGRPMNLTELGRGRLSFVTDRRYFSDDYGRTWPESVEHPPTRSGMPFHLEGNAWVDRDDHLQAKAILELGWHYEPGKSHPKDDATVVFRRSVDGGKTWIDEVAPAEWKFSVERAGRKWLRGVSEGAIARAANGDLVAALRTDMPPAYLDGPHDDSLEGTAISISKDDGKTWSPLRFLFDAGRHHANLLRLAGTAIVCTLVVRDDIQNGKLVSHRRGCDALVSHDQGQSWNQRYELDRFEFLRPDNYWVDGQCGHVAAVALPDGHVISAYGQYLLGAAVLIKWKPEPESASDSRRVQDQARPLVKIVESGESTTPPEQCRATLVGPGINQPDAFPGYGGFVGWNSPVRLKNGDWLIGFSAGYWHASPPTPLRFTPKTIEAYHKMGLPADIVAPTGGRAMIMRSADQGKTWSKPETLIDTPDDDRHPGWVELGDGTLLCSMFTYPGVEFGDIKHSEDAHRTVVIRSFDHGRTWDKQLIRPPSPFLADESDGPMVLLKDSSALLTISGMPKEGGPAQAAVFRSSDRGGTWRHLSTIKTDHDLDEANATQLPDGRFVLMARPEGDICWSDDEGQTWSSPVAFGMRMYAPSLYLLRDGTLVCLHGSYAAGHGGLRLIFSTDGGQTWIAPAKNHGFLVDSCYGYGKAMELADGSLFVIDQGTGGHGTADAKNMTLRCLRVRIRADKSGIDLLPAPNL